MGQCEICNKHMQGRQRKKHLATEKHKKKVSHNRRQMRQQQKIERTKVFQQHFGIKQRPDFAGRALFQAWQGISGLLSQAVVPRKTAMFRS